MLCFALFAGFAVKALRHDNDQVTEQTNSTGWARCWRLPGAAALLVGTFMHPAGAAPNDAPAAFAEYAADRTWIFSHLLQFAGVLLMVGALVIVARWLAGGRAAGWAQLGAVSAGAGLAVAAALQAVDGVALKAMVDIWAAAPPAEQTTAFYAALAVRQVEIGLAALLGLVLGVTAVVYGVALLIDGRAWRWLGVVALAAGAVTAVSGVMMAYAGFSDAAMTVSLTGSVGVLVWVMGVGAWMGMVGGGCARAKQSK